VPHNSENVKNVGELSWDNYKPSATTPLYDAIGKTVKEVDEKLKGEKDELSVLCVIMTDGHENASREYTRKGIFELIKKKEEEGWTFVYLGSDHDSWEAGQRLGLSRGNVKSYNKMQSKETFEELSVEAKQYFDEGAKNTKEFFIKEKLNMKKRNEKDGVKK